MSLIRKAGTLGWNVALGSFSQLLLLIEIVKSRSLLKSKFRKHREQLREQCGITVMHYSVNKSPSCRLWSHCWGLCTIMGPSIPDTERNRTHWNRKAMFFSVCGGLWVVFIYSRNAWLGPQRHWWDVSVL